MKQECTVKRLVLNEQLFSLSPRDIVLATKPYTEQYAQKLDSKKMFYESKIPDALSIYEIDGFKIARRRNFIPDSDKSITFVAIGSCIMHFYDNTTFALIVVVTKFSKQNWKPISSYAYLLETANNAMYQQIATRYKMKFPINKYEKFANNSDLYVLRYISKILAITIRLILGGNKCMFRPRSRSPSDVDILPIDMTNG